ncbi:kinase-like domain-containing protein [Xylariaceae sp. FL0255]|nr:kinase-like domain-containing protein [Xylariaceae sp. FL0255]
MVGTANPSSLEPPSFPRMRYEDAVVGKEIYNFCGNRVVEQITTAGNVVAIKVKPPGSMDRSEGAMMQYASTHGILAPGAGGVYDIFAKRKPIACVLVSGLVQGEPLDEVWHDLDDRQKSDIQNQLREQFALMRKCTETFIGRVGCTHARNSYDRIAQTFHGLFADEKEFDEWCLARLGTLTRWKWRRYLEKSRKDTPSKFVLTHGDLRPRNIMVKDGQVTGIIDWEKSGFYPDYAEYAFAMCLCHSHEEWWIPILKEILQPCSEKRLELTRLVEDRGF